MQNVFVKSRRISCSQISLGHNGHHEMNKNTEFADKRLDSPTILSENKPSEFVDNQPIDMKQTS